MNRPSGVRALRSLATEAGYPGLARELEALEARARQGRFYVAMVGQFKRGKSTLLNALLGADVLPTGVAPVTSAVTLIRFGATPRAVVHARHGAPHEIPLSSLADFVTEARNPGNRRDVAAVEVEWPLPLLASGLCLVDTPGVGSIFAANARETHGFIPHVDAVLLVLGVDPPISSAELDLLRALNTQQRPLMVVLNKVDAVRPADLAEGTAFTRNALRSHLGQEQALVALSARAAREGTNLSDGRPRGGVGDLDRALDRLARHAGSELAQRALMRGAERVRRTLLHALKLQHRALAEPAETLAQMEQALAQRGASVRDFLDNFSYRLRGEVDRFNGALSERAETFIEFQESQAGEMAGAALTAAAARGQRDLARRAETEAWGRLETDLKAWEAELLAWIEDRQRAIRERFVAEAAQLLSDVERATSGLMGDVPLPEPPSPRFAPVPRYYFAPDQAVLAMDLSGFVSRVLAAILPSGMQRSRLRRVLAERWAIWARQNATRAASEIRITTEDARRVFEWEIEEANKRLGEAAFQALAAARRRRAEGEAAVADELARVNALLKQCETLQIAEPEAPAPVAAAAPAAFP